MTHTFAKALLGAALIGATALTAAPAMASGWSQRVQGDVGIGNGRAGYNYYGTTNGYPHHRVNGYGYGYGFERGYGYPAAGPVVDGDQGFDAY